MTRPLFILDMDGVLVDFCGAAYELHGRARGPNEPGEFNFFRQWGMTDAEFWAPIDAAGSEWWADLPLLPWAEELVDLLQARGSILIATAASAHFQSAAGKVVALQRLFGKRFRDYCITPRKWLLSQPGRILIDDNDDNHFRFLAGGGDSCLLPQPWNRNRHLVAGDRLKYVRNCLDYGQPAANFVSCEF